MSAETRRPTTRPVVLVVVDGLGLRAEVEDNAVALARAPNIARFRANWPYTELAAAEMRVGLPHGQMGNSEVGHLNLGAGRVVDVDSTRITRAVRSDGLDGNAVLAQACDRVRREGSLHLLGLLSDGGVHSSFDHLEALIRLARRRGVPRLVIHAFLDGRDTPPRSATGFLERLRRLMAAEQLGRVGTVAGRYYAMDRDGRWERTEKSWRAMVLAEGPTAPDPVAAVQRSYAAGETDEFVVPTPIAGAQDAAATMRPGDSAVFFNFRADRARQLAGALGLRTFTGFTRPVDPELHFVCMTEYDESFGLRIAFPPRPLRNLLADVLSAAGLRCLRIAETEKFAHVTYFFNGGEEKAYPGEDRILIPSPRVATYDLEPAMSARLITDRLLEELRRAVYDVVVCNFANPDMVGHTGSLPAAIQAVEVVDDCLGRIAEAVLALDGALLVTADHGNCELMRDPVTGQPHTAHTLNAVPFNLIASGAGHRLRPDGALEDVAPTILGLLGLARPAEMTGRDLRLSS